MDDGYHGNTERESDFTGDGETSTFEEGKRHSEDDSVTQNLTPPPSPALYTVHHNSPAAPCSQASSLGLNTDLSTPCSHPSAHQYKRPLGSSEREAEASNSRRRRIWSQDAPPGMGPKITQAIPGIHCFLLDEKLGVFAATKAIRYAGPGEAVDRANAPARWNIVRQTGPSVSCSHIFKLLHAMELEPGHRHGIGTWEPPPCHTNLHVMRCYVNLPST